MNKPPTLTDLVFAYQASRDALIAYKFKHFKSGQFVRMNSDRFKGIGVVAYISSDVPPDQIAVRLGNDNTWWYPMVDVVEIVTDLKSLSPSDRWIKLRWHGYKQMRGPKQGSKLP